MSNVSDDVFNTFYLYELEYRAIQLDRKSREAGKLIRCVIVRDLEHLALTQASPKGLGRLKHAVTWASNHYPETAAAVYVINAPVRRSSTWLIDIFAYV